MHLIVLAQSYDDTGAASRSSIIIGALALPCLIAIAIVCQKLKNAKHNENEISKLNQQVAKLEQENQQREDHCWDEYVRALAQLPASARQLLEATEIKPEHYCYLTKPQQDYLADIFIRETSWLAAGNRISASLISQKNRIFAAKTEKELSDIFLKDAEVQRPKIEAEMLVAYMLVKQAEFTDKRLKG